MHCGLNLDFLYILVFTDHAPTSGKEAVVRHDCLGKVIAYYAIWPAPLCQQKLQGCPSSSRLGRVTEVDIGCAHR